MRTIWLALAAVFCLAATGCSSETRLDTSSEQATTDTMKAMTSGMSEEQKKEFTAATMTLVGPEMLKTAFKGAFGKQADRPKVTQSSLLKPLHGMTASEIVEKAKSSRAKAPPRQ